MKSWTAPLLAVLIAMLVIGFWFSKGQQQAASPWQTSIYQTQLHGRAAVSPLPPVPELSAEKVELGKRLFFEKRLSHDNSLACDGCHDFARGGGDHLPTAIGVGGQRGSVNTPTVFNASLNFVQFWDGRAANLEEQAAGPVHNPLEMASSWEEAIPKLSTDKGYREAFQHLYPQGITGETIVDAIATYEQTLLTPNSPFDRFLRGDQSALGERALTGYRLFLEYGCASCHQGVLLGGNMYQRFGVMGSYFKDRHTVKSIPADLGRFNVTGREEDRYVFKVPSLRNVAVTAPYFHDGSVASLEEAVSIMGRYQLGRELSAPDVLAISAFLRSLTGEWEGKPLQ
ncbi:cytochrome-c peroxidase [Rhodoferax sp.]|uniref:cytochrome-c peroxidase n=1 Tax=Rhodoferax sp. TaxID=50421 RepID=UPI0028476905|nr:cytochrome-c peroxidase [Rhodoferax sp.]MDR3369400.1 cytochrome-c peroxidase [Rhodoferax sp.]